MLAKAPADAKGSWDGPSDGRSLQWGWEHGPVFRWRLSWLQGSRISLPRVILKGTQQRTISCPTLSALGAWGMSVWGQQGIYLSSSLAAPTLLWRICQGCWGSILAFVSLNSLFIHTCWILSLYDGKWGVNSVILFSSLTLLSSVCYCSLNATGLFFWISFMNLTSVSCDSHFAEERWSHWAPTFRKMRHDSKGM